MKATYRGVRPLGARVRLRFAIATCALVVLAVFGPSPSALASSAGPPLTVCNLTFVPADAPTIPYQIGHCSPGSTFTFSRGVYRMQEKIIPREGDVLEGAGSGPDGTRFTGGKVITSWRRTNGMWVHRGDARKVGVMTDPCQIGRACDYQDWLFRDGDWLQRVLSPCTSLRSDQFCVDYKQREIYIGSTPRTHLYEYTTVTQFLVGFRFNDVTAEHFSYDEFATVGGAIQGGAGWFVNDVHGHHIHACGISLLGSTVQDPSTVQNSTFDHNGYHGYCDHGDDPQITNDDFSYNNQLHFQHGTGLGLYGALGGLIVDNYVHDNIGVGIELQKRNSDQATERVLLQSNRVIQNQGGGIRLFNACRNKIDTNLVLDNLGIAFDIDNSHDNLITGNTVRVPVDGEGGGIRIYGSKSQPGSSNCGSFDDATNNTVSFNDITMGTVADHGNFGNINGTVNAGGKVVNEAFVGNVYHLPNGDCSVRNWKWWDDANQKQWTIDFATWQNTFLLDLPPDGLCGR